MASTDAGDSVLHTSTDEPSLVKSAPVVVTPEDAIGTFFEMSVTTMTLKEPATSLAPVLSGTTSVPMDTVHTITEKKYESVSIELALAMDIMEELAHQMAQQFFISIKSCIELALFR